MKKVYQLGDKQSSNMKAVYNYARRNRITNINSLIVKDEKQVDLVDSIAEVEAEIKEEIKEQVKAKEGVSKKKTKKNNG